MLTINTTRVLRVIESEPELPCDNWRDYLSIATLWLSTLLCPIRTMRSVVRATKVAITDNVKQAMLNESHDERTARDVLKQFSQRFVSPEDIRLGTPLSVRDSEQLFVDMHRAIDASDQHGPPRPRALH